MTAAVNDTARTPTTLAMDAVRLLREWTWLRSLLLVIVFAVSCGLLGHWQWSRHLEKAAASRLVTANYTSDPVALAQLLPHPDSALAPSLEWRQVRVTGTYLSDHAVLIRNRPYNGAYGYDVVVPLRTATGAILLVDRGWVPNGRTGADPDIVPAPPSGQVEVVTRLRPSEPAATQTPPPGQAMRINVEQLSGKLDAPTYQAYGVLASESPQAAPAPRPLAAPDTDLGNNLAYALQWWFFGVGGGLLLCYYAFREAQNRDLRARGLDPVQVRKRRSRREPEDEDEEW